MESRTFIFHCYQVNENAVWIAAIDKAGNITALTEPAIEFTTAKTIPYVKNAPVLSGNYGDTVSAMLKKADTTKASVTAGQNSDTKIEGTWILASEDADKIPTVGTSEKYTLVFTPTGSDADTYDPVTCEVTPEVSKKQITVVIADKEKFIWRDKPCTYMESCLRCCLPRQCFGSRWYRRKHLASAYQLLRKTIQMLEPMQLQEHQIVPIMKYLLLETVQMARVVF